MTTPTRLLGALLATVLAAACDPGTAHDDAPRLAVVLTDGGVEQNVGSYDVESGEITLAPEVQADLRERLGDAERPVIVTHDGEAAAIDLDAGVAMTTAELGDGEVLELRAVGTDAGAATLGRLELRLEGDQELRKWDDGNVTGLDDWEKHNR